MELMTFDPLRLTVLQGITTYFIKMEKLRKSQQKTCKIIQKEIKLEKLRKSQQNTKRKIE